MALNGLPLDFSQIQAFFSNYGVAADLKSYYRGGGLVPNTAQNANIPTTGTIKISDFVNASHWPIDPTLIVGNIPGFNLSFSGSSSSDHFDSWFINPANNQVVQGLYTTSNGSADPTLIGRPPVYNGAINPATPMGVMIQYQNFISQHCLGGNSWLPGYAYYQPQGSGTLNLNYGTTITGVNPSGGRTLGAFGGAHQGAPGAGFVATAIYLMINYGIASGGNTQLINQLRSYNWDVTSTAAINSNFSAFAAWVAAN
jgi:hypothetical protein